MTPEPNPFQVSQEEAAKCLALEERGFQDVGISYNWKTGERLIIGRGHPRGGQEVIAIAPWPTRWPPVWKEVHHG